MLLLNLKPSHGTDIEATGDTGDANVEMLTLMLSLSLKLSHTTMYTILIIPTITLVKDLLMPSLTHGMDTEDMVDTGVANVAPLKLSHGDMEDMDTVDTGEKITRISHETKMKKLMDESIIVLVYNLVKNYFASYHSFKIKLFIQLLNIA